MINIKPKIKMGGVNYHFEVINKETGVIKQTVDSHNIFLNQWWSLWGSDNNTNDCFPKYIAYGGGTGDVSSADTDLFYLFRYVFMESSSSVLSEDKKTAVITIVYHSINEGDALYINEVGLAGSIDYTTRLLMTHSVLPATIVQSINDVLITTVTYTITLTTAYDFKWFELDTRYLIGLYVPNDDYKNLIITPRRGGLCPNQKPMGYVFNNIETSPETFSLGVFNSTTKKMSYNSRMNSLVGNTHYYNSVVTYDGYIPLPNANVFPNYYIPNIAIGTGNGVITDFINPLNYFIENTDIVYKNGVSLTRGTDYTIDYRNNREMLPELTPCVEENTIYAGQQDDLVTNNDYYPLFISNLPNTCVQLDTSSSINRLCSLEDIPLFLSTLTPLIITFDNNKLINTLHLGNLVYNTPNGLSTHVIQVILEYATQEEPTTWLTIIPLSTPFTSSTGMTFTFVNTIAKYWRITIMSSDGVQYVQYKTINFYSNNCFLGYVGDPYIKFTTAPADGDVLTMSVQMDRPFKNANFAIDLNLEVTYYQ